VFEIENHFARPEQSLFRESALPAYRHRIGMVLAKNQRVEADIVIGGFPYSGISSADRFSPGQVAFPYADALIKIAMSGRTFHPRPTQAMREAGIIDVTPPQFPCPMCMGRQAGGWW